MLLVAVGLLGAVRIHVRAIEYTVDTERRQMASMLASELLETLRGYGHGPGREGLARGGAGRLPEAGGCGDARGPCGLPAFAAAAEQRLACWGDRARKLVPDLTADRIDSSFAVSADADGLVSVTVAWPVKKGQCLDGSDNEFCTFTLRSRL